MLQVNQRIIIAGEQWTVAYVNFSRAHCVQQCRELVEIRKWGCTVRTMRTFWSTRRRTTDISPDSVVEVL